MPSQQGNARAWFTTCMQANQIEPPLAGTILFRYFLKKVNKCKFFSDVSMSTAAMGRPRAD
jgi:hypothetical protein